MRQTHDELGNKRKKMKLELEMLEIALKKAEADVKEKGVGLSSAKAEQKICAIEIKGRLEDIKKKLTQTAAKLDD